MKYKVFIFMNILVIFILTFCGCNFNSVQNDIPQNLNESELTLINYIIENGEYDPDEHLYSISESITEVEIDFTYSIEYNVETKELIFKEQSYVAGGLTFTYMYYEYEANEQNIEVNMVVPSGDIIKSQGVIYPASYTRLNRTIYSFKSSYNNYSELQSICETNVYSMLNHCQLLMIDAGVGLVSFGFEKGIF